MRPPPLDLKARFVGGPWHNRVVAVKAIPVIFVAEPSNFTLDLVLRPVPAIGDNTLKKSEYYLARFVSDCGAHYFQYIHESLMGRDAPCRTTYTDPPLPAELPRDLIEDFWTKLIRVVAKQRLQPVSP